MRRALTGALAALAVGACEPQSAAHGPLDVWAYADPDVEPWDRIDVDAHERAIATLNRLAGSEGCFRLVLAPWGHGRPPSGVAVSVVDNDRANGIARGHLAPGEIVNGAAEPTAPAGGYVVMKTTTAHEDATIAHEVLHLVLGRQWPHDDTGLFSAYGDGDRDAVSPETQAALAAFCQEDV